MNMHELPMIFFTVLSQMSVGAFVALGVVQTLALGRYPGTVIDRLGDPALLAIGPTLVAGLFASMLHMNDPTNTLNVIRHWNSSWLSREILVGMAFAGLGLAFSVLQWRRIGSPGARRLLALLTAGVGLVLVWCQSMIYYSLVTVPAWNSWATPLRFFATTVLLGSLAVGVALAWTLGRSELREFQPDESPPARSTPDGPSDESEPAGGGRVAAAVATLTRPVSLTDTERRQATELVRRSLRVISVVTMTTALALVISLPLYLAGLSANGQSAAATSAGTFDGLFYAMRLVLLGVGAVVLALVTFRLAGDRRSTTQALTALVFVALVVTFVSEIMGRSIFYDSMTRIGM